MKFEIKADHILVTDGQKSLILPLANEDDVMVVSLDDASHWAAPDDGIEISLDDLRAIAAGIETAADKQGIAIEFD